MKQIIEVRVFNSENNTHYYFNLYHEKVQEFFTFLLAKRQICHGGSPMPGLNATASLALEKFFVTIPPRFPLVDLVRFLRQDQKNYCGGEYPNPTITFEELEDALVRWHIHEMNRVFDNETKEQ